MPIPSFPAHLANWHSAIKNWLSCYKTAFLSVALILCLTGCNPPLNKRHVLIIGDDYAVGKGSWVEAFQRLRKGGPLLNTAVTGATTAFPSPLEPALNTSDQLVPNLRRGFAEMGAIDEIIVQLGLNDCQSKYQAGNIEQAVSFRKLIDEIKVFFDARGQDAPRIVLVTPPPLADDGQIVEKFKGGASCIAEITENVRDFAAKEGLCFVDLSKNTQLPSFRASDGYSYSPKGLELMAIDIMQGCY